MIAILSQLDVATLCSQSACHKDKNNNRAIPAIMAVSCVLCSGIDVNGRVKAGQLDRAKKSLVTANTSKCIDLSLSKHGNWGCILGATALLSVSPRGSS